VAYCVAQLDTIGWPDASHVNVLPWEHASAADIWDGHTAACWPQPVRQSAFVGGPFVQCAATTAGQIEVQLDERELAQAYIAAYSVVQPAAIGWPLESQVKLLPCAHAYAAENWDGHAVAIWLQPETQSAAVGGPPVQPGATTAGQIALQLLLPVLPFELLELHPAATATT
jgi:hypothetical protein